MRLAIISDIHGNLPALETTLARIHKEGCDTIVNLGDCVTGPLWPRETLQLLDMLDLPTVRGNHDRWLVEEPPAGATPSVVSTRAALSEVERRRLAVLPATLRLADDILAVHGTPASDTAYLLEEKVGGRLALVTTEQLQSRLGLMMEGLVLCGHSHNQHVASAFGHTVVLNPGSVGCPRYAENGDWEENEAGSPHARFAIAERKNDRWSASLFALEYDWSQVAKRARANGREDYAKAFLR